MKKTYKLIATLLMAVLALQGCVKEYTNALPGEEQPTPEQPVVEDDDMVTLLKSIQGVSDVEMKMVPFANGSTIANYFFNYEQLVDQFDEKKGTFKQRIAMQLADSSAPVIVPLRPPVRARTGLRGHGLRLGSRTVHHPRPGL